MITGFTYTQDEQSKINESAGNWRKEYKLLDHLGSVRTVLRKSLTDNSYEYREQISYNPFGEVRDRLYCTDNTTPDARLKYIGKQLDYESNLADHGKSITNYELRITTSLAMLGQFSSPDPMWEEYKLTFAIRSLVTRFLLKYPPN